MMINISMTYGYSVPNWVYRSIDAITTSPEVIPTMPMDVCMLTSNEVGRLRHYQVQPLCSDHDHVSFNQALEKIQSGDAEIVEDARTGRTCLTPAILHYLAPRKSGRTVAVIQRVKMVPPLIIIPPLGER